MALTDNRFNQPAPKQRAALKLTLRDARSGQPLQSLRPWRPIRTGGRPSPTPPRSPPSRPPAPPPLHLLLLAGLLRRILLFLFLGHGGTGTVECRGPGKSTGEGKGEGKWGQPALLLRLLSLGLLSQNGGPCL